ncbi:MAG TPA: hypothetical protein VFW03_22935 [Gemmatimonadaceae bacterium]|nr:hypothetical protein [Gemmatimonadaceae bacterium]
MSRLFTTRLFKVSALVAAMACANGNTGTGPDQSDHVLVQIDPTPTPYVIYDGPFYAKGFVVDSGNNGGKGVLLER